MGDFPAIDLEIIFLTLLALTGTGILITLAILGWVIWRVKRIQLPAGADFFTAMRYTPLSVAILLDLLDFTFDILSIPFAWVILGYLGLKPLRGVTVVEAAIPGTQLIPLLTISWLFIRLRDKQFTL